MQAASQTVELPYDEDVVFTQRLQAGLQTRPLVLLAGGTVGIDAALVDAGGRYRFGED